MMNIAYFSKDMDMAFNPPNCTIEIFNTYETFENSNFIPGCIILGKLSLSEITTLIKSFRQNNQFFLIPLFTTESYDQHIMYLCDGLVNLNNIEGIMTIANEINELREILPPLVNMYDLDTKLLQYIFTRTNKSILPFLEWHRDTIYFYPLAECLAIDKTDIVTIINNLINRKLIQQFELIDRLHCCPKCNFPHINFIDVCPNCQSININETEFLHCFTCGHVAPEKDFLEGNRLHCPRCQAILRHIGADYDRPVENYHCNTCQENFSEPDVIAHCLICREKTETDELISNDIYSYKLSDLGQLNTRNNSITDIYSLLDNLNYLNPMYFNTQLNWIIHIAVRHTEINFGLLGIEIQGLDKIVAKQGRFIAHKVMEGAAGRIRHIVRDTDITTRTSSNRLWLLAPQTSLAGCNIISKRLNEIGELSLQDDGSQLKFKIVIVFSADLHLTDETAETILAKLNSELDK